MGGAWPTAVALTGARHRRRASTVVGVTVAIGALGCVVAPPVMGTLFQVTDPGAVMALPAIPLLLGGLLSLPVPRRMDGHCSTAQSEPENEDEEQAACPQGAQWS
jgi:hypothetical protein